MKLTSFMALLIVVLLSPVAMAQLPAIYVDMDRNTAGVQSSLDRGTLTGGQTIEGAVYMEGFGGVVEIDSCSAGILVGPTGTAQAGSLTASTVGGTNTSNLGLDLLAHDFFILGFPPDGVDLPGNLFTFDLVLPDLLRISDGTEVSSSKEWQQTRRAEVLEGATLRRAPENELGVVFHSARTRSSAANALMELLGR